MKVDFAIISHIYRNKFSRCKNDRNRHFSFFTMQVDNVTLFLGESASSIALYV